MVACKPLQRKCNALQFMRWQLVACIENVTFSREKKTIAGLATRANKNNSTQVNEWTYYSRIHFRWHKIFDLNSIRSHRVLVATIRCTISWIWFLSWSSWIGTISFDINYVILLGLFIDSHKPFPANYMRSLQINAIPFFLSLSLARAIRTTQRLRTMCRHHAWPLELFC